MLRCCPCQISTVKWRVLPFPRLKPKCVFGNPPYPLRVILQALFLMGILMIQWKQSVFLWNGYLLIPNPSDGFIGPVREGYRQFFYVHLPAVHALSYVRTKTTTYSFSQRAFSFGTLVRWYSSMWALCPCRESLCCFTNCLSQSGHCRRPTPPTPTFPSIAAFKARSGSPPYFWQSGFIYKMF